MNYDENNQNVITNSNENMVEKKSKKVNVFLIVMIVFVILIAGGYFALRFMASSLKTVLETQVDLTVAKNLYLDDVIAATKDYYYKNDLVKVDNLEYWKVQKSELVGYYEDSNDIVYYSVEGVYKCLNDSGDCLYLEQVGEANSKGEYDFKVYVGMNTETEPYTVKSVSGSLVTDGFVEENSLINKVNEELENSIIESLKNKMIESSLYDETNVANVVLTAEYEKILNGEVYFHVYGKYLCVDNSSDCIYQSQVGDPIDSFYDISLFVIGEVKDNKFTLSSIDDCMVELPLNNQEVFEHLKNYYKTTGFLTEANLTDWILESVTYVGIVNNSYSFDVVSKFKCVSQEVTCLYVPQLDIPDQDGYYTIKINVNITDKDGSYVVASVE